MTINSAARWLSMVLHPLFMPLLSLVLAFQLDFRLSFFIPPTMRWITYGMVFVMTVLFPLTSTLMLIRGGMVSSLRMPERRERIGPFIMAILYFSLAYWLLKRNTHHEATYALFTGGLLALAATTVITFFWKVSVHMVGIGGLLGMLSALAWLHDSVPLWALSIAIVLCGALGRARLVDGGHTPGQVGAGMALGYSSVLACMAGSWYL